MSVSLDSAAIPEDEWVRVCGTDDVAENTAISVDVDGDPICVARSNGCFYAVFDECTHAEVPLSEGDVEDGTVECWMHGSRFDLRTGEPTGLPATDPVQVFPVRVDGDDVYVTVKE